MAEFYGQLNDELINFINRQHLFFVATASAESRINLSPKGMDGLRVLNARPVAYLDLTSSGYEAAAHPRHDGRLTIMLCSFDKQPLIVRLHGTGHVVYPKDSQWPDRMAAFIPTPGSRLIIVLNITSVQTFCGYAVPLYCNLPGRGDTLRRWALRKGEQRLQTYRHRNNRVSIDGLPSDHDDD